MGSPSSPLPHLPHPPHQPDSVRGRGFPELPEGCSQLVWWGPASLTLHTGPLLVLGSPIPLEVFPDPRRLGECPQLAPPSSEGDLRELKPRLAQVRILTPALMRFGAGASLNLHLTF